MLPFAFLILQKPSIASLIRSFTFRGLFHIERYPPNNSDENKRRLPWPNHVERDDILMGVIKRISNSEDEEMEWNEAVLSQNAPADDAILSLLLISFPNLRRLDLEITGLEVNFLARTFIRVACSEPPFDINPVFTQLTDIMLTGSDDLYPTEYVLFGACCRLLAVKRLYGHRLGAREDYADLSALTGGTTIETLRSFVSRNCTSMTSLSCSALSSPYGP